MHRLFDEKIVFDGNVNESFDGLSESAYLEEIFSHLDFSKLGPVEKIHVRGSNYANPPTYYFEDFEISKSSAALIYLSEDYRTGVPEAILDGYRRKFVCYKNSNQYFSFPLGLEKDTLHRIKHKKFTDKDHFAFFSGALNINRISLYKELFSLRLLPDHLIERVKNSQLNFVLPKEIKSNNNQFKFTTGFKMGDSPEEYSQLLMKAKVSICPKGFHSTETFRHYESLKAGCVVISETLPESWMYKDSPIIQLKSWRELRPILNKLRKNESMLEDLSIASHIWYQERLSPKSVAHYISEKCNE